MSAAACQAAFYHLDETFTSGATFSGDLTFTAGLDNLTAVNGTLTGVPAAPTQSISWIWDPTVNYAGGYPLGGNFLMSGTDSSNYRDFISMTWDYSSRPVLTLVGSAVVIDDPTFYGPFGNNVDYIDGMVSYTLTAVPEPSTYVAGALLLLPFGASALRILRKRQVA